MKVFTRDDYLDYYCRMGYRVFPVSVSKRPMITGWKEKATSNIDEAKALFARFPKAGVALALGGLSGLSALDIDEKNGKSGSASIVGMFGPIEIPENWLIAITPSGGCHYFFKWDPRFPVTSHVGVIDGVDIKGEGGFVVVQSKAALPEDEPKSYEFINIESTPAEAPEWVNDLYRMALAKKRRERPAQVSFDVSPVMTGIAEGGRDDNLHRYASHLRGKGVDFSLALGFIKEAAARCNPVFPEQEAVEKVLRAYEKI